MDETKVGFTPPEEEEQEEKPAQIFLDSIHEAENSPVIDQIWEAEDRYYSLMEKYGSPRELPPEQLEERKQDYIQFTLSLDKEMVGNLVGNPELFAAYEKQKEAHLSAREVDPRTIDPHITGDYTRTIIFNFITGGLDADQASKLMDDCILANGLRAGGDDVGLIIARKGDDIEAYKAGLKEVFGDRKLPPNYNYYSGVIDGFKAWWFRHFDELPEVCQRSHQFWLSLNTLARYMHEERPEARNVESLSQQSELYREMSGYGNMYHEWRNAFEGTMVMNMSKSYWDRKLFEMMIDPKAVDYFKEEFEVSDSSIETAREVLQAQKG